MKIVSAILLATTLALVTAATAQQPARIRGQIEKMDGSAMALKQRDGSMLNVKLADDARVAALNKATIADIKNDTFIGVAGMPRPDGSIEAHSIHIFLPAQRGVVADRHGPWDSRPGSMMTNAYVEGMPVAAADGQSIKVKYKEGEKTIIITPQTAIAAVAAGNKDELKPGTQIIIMQSEKAADGSVTAKNLYLGRSLTPAM